MALSAAASDAASPTEEGQIDPLWTLVAAEGPHKVYEHRCLPGPALPASPGGPRSPVEDIHLATAEGAWVEFATPLRPMAIIDELQLAVKVFSNRPGVRLIAEVVLPHAEDERRGEPLRVQLFGPSHERVGEWQELTLEGLPELVAQNVRNLQITAGEPIDSRGAYVDGLRLRVRPGRGETRLRLQPPRHRGGVTVRREDGAPGPGVDRAVQQASGQYVPSTGIGKNAREEPPQVALTGGVLHVSGKPLFPRVIEHAGGPLRYARELGCNVVLLSSPPTRAQDKEAEAADLWLVAPPPDPQLLAARGKMAAFPRVIAWHLGHGLTTLDLEATHQWAGVVRRLDPARGRPIAGSVRFGHRALSRILDIVVIDRRPLGASLPLTRFVQRLETERRLVQPGKTVWMRVQTQLPQEVVQQAQWLVPEATEPFESRVPVDNISRLTWIALAYGMDGVIFGAPASGVTDDGDDPTTAELELVNDRLDLLDSLLVGTGTVRRVTQLAPGLQAGVLSDGRSHCVLPWSEGAPQRLWAGPGGGAVRHPRNAPFIVPGVAEPSDAFLLTTTGAHRLSATREAGGVRVATGPLLPRDIVLLSQNPLATQRLRARVAETATRMAALERVLVNADDRGSGVASPLVHRASDSGPRTLHDSLPPGTFTGQWSDGFGTSSSDLSPVRRLRVSLAGSRGGANGYGSSDPHRSVALDRIPELIHLGERFGLLDHRPLPTPDLLPAGGFEGIEAARQAGWRHIQLAEVATHGVELVSTGVHSGAHCLRIFSASGGGEGVGLFATAWMRSPVVPLRAGDVVRVTGWVRTSTPQNSGRATHAVIEDTLGGEPLSLDFAPDRQWRPFVMYRATAEHHQWSLRLSCTGPGDVFFDDLAVQRVPPDVVARVGGRSRKMEGRVK